MGRCLFLLVGMSGSGKTSIAEALKEKYGLTSIQSYTTRKPRYDNEQGHIFVDKETFDSLQDKVAYTKFNNNEYCATAEQIENNDIYVIDPKGIKELRKNYKGKKIIYTIYIECKLSDRYERMRKRGNSCDEALKRIINDAGEFKNYKNYCNIAVKNNNSDNFDKVVSLIYQFIKNKEVIF